MSAIRLGDLEGVHVCIISVWQLDRGVVYITYLAIMSRVRNVINPLAGPT